METTNKKQYPKPNTVILTGHLTMEPRESETKGNTPRRMASFSLGQPDVLSPETPTYWQCIAWNNAEGYGPATFILDVANKPGTELTVIGKLLQKLEEVQVQGEDKPRKIRTTTILVEQVFFAGSARRSDDAETPAESNAPRAPRKGTAAPTTRPSRSTPVAVAADDDDLPF